MNMTIHSISNHAIFLFKENVSSFLTAQQKRILIVVSVALGFLAVCYLASRYCHFKAEPRNESEKTDSDEIVYENGSKDEKLKSQEKKTEFDKKVEEIFEGEELIQLTSSSKPPLEPELLTDEYGVINGKGKRIYPSAFDPRTIIAEGEFKDGKLNGQGKCIYPIGTIDEGEFKDGKLNGKGKITLVDGSVFEGEFKDGWLNGKGKRPYIDGAIGEGEFKDGELNGKGKKTWPDGRIEEGIFQDGVLIKGKRIYPESFDPTTIFIAEGEFKDGKLNGQGKLIYPDGRIDEGEFEDDFLNGKGKQTWPDGSIEEGEFKVGWLNGKGKKFCSLSHIRDEGEFKYGRLNGKGKRIYPSGRIEEGEFKDSTFIVGQTQ